MIDAVMGPWAPWASGILIGLMVPAMYLLVGRGFGVSQSLQHISAICLPKSKTTYLSEHNWRDYRWNLVLIGGLVVGAFVGAQFLSSETLEVLPEAANTGGGLVRLAFGGTLVGFGTRYAGGCTSGHTITGISNMNLPSVIASAAFFAGGAIATWGLTFLIF